MKKTQKKNNKGFSLVELIVVVLIMAIIAVALAPQVMKWVDNSRKATDASNYDAIISAVQLAAVSNSNIAGTIDSAASSTSDWIVNDSGSTGLENAINGILGDKWKNELKPKYSSHSAYQITVTSVNGKVTVTRTAAPDSNIS